MDLSSALVVMLMSSSKLFLFFAQSLFKLRYKTVIGIVLCYSHQACCLLHYLCEINNGIHIYQFAFELSPFCFWMWLRCQFELKDWQIYGFGEKKKAWIGRFAYPYSPPPSREFKKFTQHYKFKITQLLTCLPLKLFHLSMKMSFPVI